MAYRNYHPTNGFSVSLDGNGDFQDIQSAINAASAGTTIFMHDGTYTQNITGKAGVSLTANLGDANEPNVTIIGTVTFSTTGTFSISNVQLQTNGSNFLTVAGTSATIVNLNDCKLNCINSTGISFSTANSSSIINLQNCIGDLGTTGIGFWSMSSTGTMNVNYLMTTNSGNSTSSSSNSNGQVDISNSAMQSSVSSTGTGGLNVVLSNFLTLGFTTFLFNGTGPNNLVNSSTFSSTASSMTIGTGATALISFGSLGSSNTNVITGSGILNLGTVNFTSTSRAINTSTINLLATSESWFPSGITFDDSNILSNYATGSFVPTLTGATIAGTTTYSIQQGYYTRIGNMVTVWAQLQGSAATGTGDATFGGLPFTIKNQANFSPNGNILSFSAASWVFPVGTTYLVFNGTLNTTNAVSRGVGSATSGGNLQMANAAFGFEFTMSYQI
jgi:hypothetical protein